MSSAVLVLLLLVTVLPPGQGCEVWFTKQPPDTTCDLSTIIELVCAIRYTSTYPAAAHLSLVWLYTTLDDDGVLVENDESQETRAANSIVQELQLQPSTRGSQDRVYWCQVCASQHDCTVLDTLLPVKSNMINITSNGEKENCDEVLSVDQTKCVVPLAATTTSSVSGATITVVSHTPTVSSRGPIVSSHGPSPSPTAANKQPSLLPSTITISVLSASLLLVVVLLVIVCSVTVCLGVANRKYRQRQREQHHHLEHVYSSCDQDGKQQQQLPLYLSPDKLHTQPTMKQKGAREESVSMSRGGEVDPVYEELESHQTGPKQHTLYQQLSTVSRDYMTVYSITTPTDHTPQHLIDDTLQHLTDDNSQQSTDHTPQHLTDDTPQQSTDHTPQQHKQSTVEPDQPPDHTQPVIKLDGPVTETLTKPVTEPAGMLAGEPAGIEPASVLTGEAASVLTSEEQTEEEITVILKRGLTIQYSNTSMGSYVAMKPSDC